MAQAYYLDDPQFTDAVTVLTQLLGVKRGEGSPQALTDFVDQSRPQLGQCKHAVEETQRVWALFPPGGDGAALPSKQRKEIQDMVAAFNERMIPLQEVLDGSKTHGVSVVNELKGSAEQLGRIVPWLLFIAVRSMQPDRWRSLLKDAESKRDAAETASSKIAGFHEEAKRLTEDMKSRQQLLTLGVLAQKFEKQADMHFNNSWGFGVAAICLGFLVFSAVMVMIMQTPPGSTFTSFFVSGRLLLSLFGGSLVFWLARLHRSEKHNEVVCRHKALAIGTFDSFVASSRLKDDDDVRNVMLLELARAVFSPAVSGYLGGRENMVEPAEVLSLLGKRGGS